MKRTIRLISLFLILTFLFSSLIACGGATETETETEKATETEASTEEEKETQFDRNSVKDDIPTDLNFSNSTNNTITFFVRSDRELCKYEMDVDEIMDDTLYDAIYYRNRTVESRLGVEITTIAQDGNYTKSNEWNQTLRNAVSTKSGDFDSAAIYMSTGSALAVEGMYYNLLDFPNLNLAKPWWNQSISEELTLFDTLYYLAGDLAVSETAYGGCFFFNKELMEKFYPDGLDLYELVETGEWTVDEMYDVIAPVWEDTNSDGVKSDGDFFGFTDPFGDGSNMDVWIVALGIDLTSSPNGVPELSFYSERTIMAHEKLQQLYLNNPGSWQTPLANVVESSFENGRSLFKKGILNDGSAFRDVTFGYGIVPLPKFDTEQENYRTICYNVASLVVILASLPDDRCDMVGATLELMAAESYKQVTPAYYEINLKSKYSDAPEDAAIYDLILSSFTYNFGYCYSTQSLGAIGTLFRNISLDLAQQYESNQSKYQTALETLIDKLDEAAYLAQSGK